MPLASSPPGYDRSHTFLPKTVVFPPPAYYNPIRPGIVPAIRAICVLIFTSEKWWKSGNYARFFANYARNPGPDRAFGIPPGSCHRRRVQSGKVLLSPRLFAAPRTYGLTDTRLTYTQNPRRCPSEENRDAESRRCLRHLLHSGMTCVIPSSQKQGFFFLQHITVRSPLRSCPQLVLFADFLETAGCRFQPNGWRIVNFVKQLGQF